MKRCPECGCRLFFNEKECEWCGPIYPISEEEYLKIKEK